MRALLIVGLGGCVEVIPDERPVAPTPLPTVVPTAPPTATDPPPSTCVDALDAGRHELTPGAYPDLRVAVGDPDLYAIEVAHGDVLTFSVEGDVQTRLDTGTGPQGVHQPYVHLGQPGSVVLQVQTSSTCSTYALTFEHASDCTDPAEPDDTLDTPAPHLGQTLAGGDYSLDHQWLAVPAHTALEVSTWVDPDIFTQVHDGPETLTVTGGAVSLPPAQVDREVVFATQIAGTCRPYDIHVLADYGGGACAGDTNEPLDDVRTLAQQIQAPPIFVVQTGIAGPEGDWWKVLVPGRTTTEVGVANGTSAEVVAYDALGRELDRPRAATYTFHNPLEADLPFYLKVTGACDSYEIHRVDESQPLEVCSNGFDDDGDGQVDIDAECQCVPSQSLPGPADGAMGGFVAGAVPFQHVFTGVPVGSFVSVDQPGLYWMSGGAMVPATRPTLADGGNLTLVAPGGSCDDVSVVLSVEPGCATPDSSEGGGLRLAPDQGITGDLWVGETDATDLVELTIGAGATHLVTLRPEDRAQGDIDLAVDFLGVEHRSRDVVQLHNPTAVDAIAQAYVRADSQARCVHYQLFNGVRSPP